MDRSHLVSDSEFWNQKYIINDTSWDLHGPTPYFSEWIKLQTPPLKICILGAGNGYDAFHFSSLGHDVTAVDFADEPIKFMNQKSKELSQSINVVQDDIFNLPHQYSETFDIVFEQTCFCAINPRRREEYVKMVHSILNRDGRFVGFLFPINKDENEGGPPFAVKLEKTLPLFEKYFNLLAKYFPDKSITQRKGNEFFVEMGKN